MNVGQFLIRIGAILVLLPALALSVMVHNYVDNAMGNIPGAIAPLSLAATTLTFCMAPISYFYARFVIVPYDNLGA